MLLRRELYGDGYERKRIYFDMDGVLADFKGGFKKMFGTDVKEDTYDPPDMFERINMHGSFYLSLEPLVDGIELWDKVIDAGYRPIVLTGVPYSVKDADSQKRRWVNRHVSRSAIVVSGRSAEKSNYCQEGDILIDDRLKYSSLWINRGGIFIHHQNGPDTLEQLRGLGLVL